MVPDGDVVYADVLLRHAEQEVWELNVQEKRQILHFPVHGQEVQQAGLHTGQGWQQSSGDHRPGSGY